MKAFEFEEKYMHIYQKCVNEYWKKLLMQFREWLQNENDDATYRKYINELSDNISKITPFGNHVKIMKVKVSKDYYEIMLILPISWDIMTLSVISTKSDDVYNEIRENMEMGLPKNCKVINARPQFEYDFLMEKNDDAEMLEELTQLLKKRRYQNE